MEKPEESRTAREKRDADICAYYAAGYKLSQTASHFRLGRQRVMQILKKAGAWRPYVKTGRTKFLGTTVSEETKAALHEEARRRGISVSELTDEAIQAMLAGRSVEVAR